MGEKSEQADHELSAPSPCDNTPDDVSDLDVNVVEDQGDGPSRELLRAELAQPFSAVVNAGPSEETVHSVVDFKMPTIGTGGGRSVLATSTLSQLIKTAGRSTIGMDTVAALGHAGGPASAFTTGLGAPSISARALGLTTPSISARALGLTTPSISARALGLTGMSGGAFAAGLTARSTTAQRIGLKVFGPGLGPDASVLATPALASLRAIRTEQLIATTGFARALKAPALDTAWRDNILAATTARSLVGTMSVAAPQRRTLNNILGINAATGAVVARYAAANPDLRLAPLSRISARALRTLLLDLPEQPTALDLNRASDFSRSVAGLTAADLLLGSGILDPETTDDLEEQVVDPWITDEHQERAELYDTLDQFNPAIAEFLHAAWDQIDRDGPAAVSLTAHAIVEALDHTLRHGAPDPAVLAAAERGDLGEDATFPKDGKPAPTRRGRIAYILSLQQGSHLPLIQDHVSALAKTTNQLFRKAQGAKHASNVELKLVQTYLVSAESILRQLVVHS